MATHIYRKPKDRITDVYYRKELEAMVSTALKKTFSAEKIAIKPAKVRRFLDILSSQNGYGDLVLIIESKPLNSDEVKGAFGDRIFMVNKKHRTQYSKKYQKPTNPRTPAQQKQRSKYALALKEWKALSDTQKALWNEQAKNKPLSGYNLFVSNYLKTH